MVAVNGICIVHEFACAFDHADYRAKVLKLAIGGVEFSDLD